MWGTTYKQSTSNKSLTSGEQDSWLAKVAVGVIAAGERRRVRRSLKKKNGVQVGEPEAVGCC